MPSGGWTFLSVTNGISAIGSHSQTNEFLTDSLSTPVPERAVVQLGASIIAVTINHYCRGRVGLQIVRNLGNMLLSLCIQE